MYIIVTSSITSSESRAIAKSYLTRVKGRSRGISVLKASWHELATIEERDGSGIKPDAVVGQARIRTGFDFLPLCGFQNPDLSSI